MKAVPKLDESESSSGRLPEVLDPQSQDCNIKFCTFWEKLVGFLFQDLLALPIIFVLCSAFTATSVLSH